MECKGEKIQPFFHSSPMTCSLFQIKFFQMEQDMVQDRKNCDINRNYFNSIQKTDGTCDSVFSLEIG